MLVIIMINVCFNLVYIDLTNKNYITLKQKRKQKYKQKH